MAASNTLIETLAHLQQHVAVAYGRRLLLDYARKSAGARLGLLFRVDTPGQQLMLLERCGRPPRQEHLSEHTHIMLDGLFGTVLHHQGVLQVSDSYSDPRSLPVERSWTWRGGRVHICAVGTGSAISDSLGVMVLCAGPIASETPVKAHAESEMMICAALLGVYLEDVSVYTDEVRAGDASVPSLHLHIPRPYDGGMAHKEFSQTLQGELELLVDTALDAQALHRKILDYLGSELHASGGSMWLYQPSQARFALSTSVDMDASALALTTDALAGLAGERRDVETDMERGLRVVTWSPEYILMLHLLRCTGQLVGAVAFTVKSSAEPPTAKRDLFARLCDVSAVILRNQQLRIEEQQAAIDRERSRIARDMHDGAAQCIAHAIHTLEFAQRMLEKQPQAAQREILRARETLLESLNDLRHDISALLPVQLEQANFDEAVRGLLDDFGRHESSIALRYEGSQITHLPPSLEVPIYRLLQEALNNVRKHARASQVSVQVQPLPGLLVAQVSDDGAGFDVQRSRRDGRDAAKYGALAHFGLRAMQERVEQAGGILDIVSKPGAGTTIKARFPLALPPISLTSREREVLRLLADGATNRAIAGKLSVSIETVKSHVHHIMQKLQVKDRTQAAVLAARRQWV
ncbi:MAG TPA: LuxR C-terminal-related transcriptional regulator [Ktedonobacteraceae bacterium]|nr:LuxR C-terminal-related transcriptional regulator [Ktedonobacteraceae bacterium]